MGGQGCTFGADSRAVAITSTIDAYVGVDRLDDQPGCVVLEPYVVFDALNNGDVDAGFADYIAFVGAGLISGDLRFYGPSSLRTPFSFESISGACADLPGIPEAEQPAVNAWLWFKNNMIAMAAGWHEGLTGTAKGTPRPPLCHYSDPAP